jgi:hypothetical protein
MHQNLEGKRLEAFKPCAPFPILLVLLQHPNLYAKVPLFLYLKWGCPLVAPGVPYHVFLRSRMWTFIWLGGIHSLSTFCISILFPTHSSFTYAHQSILLGGYSDLIGCPKVFEIF